MNLHDVAVFAATLSDFVRNEALADVVDLYTAFGLPTTTPVEQKDVDNVVKAYTLQLLNENVSIDSLARLAEEEQYMIEDYPDWGPFQEWMQDVRQTMSFERSRRSFKEADLSLENVAEEVMELNDRLGAYQDISCKTLKAGLADIDHTGTGRVLMSDFYRVGLTGDHLFIEHTDFLRRLGALDETDPHHPSVLIVNYLTSQANCIASTSFHSVCCTDECEGLMGHLERSIAAPTATPGRIAELVAGLRSDTVDAPRNLSSALLSRLGEIADHHDGLVPLHGRLFAQWMHHAYPLECPYPHATGTTQPLTPDEWMEERGVWRIEAPAAEREHYIGEEARMKFELSHEKNDELPWEAVEDLVVRHSVAKAGWMGALVR